MRAAFDDLSWNLHVGRSGIEAVGLATTARILRNAASLDRIRLMLWQIPIGRPFPHVADHVVEAIPIRWEGGNRRGPLKTIRIGVLAGELTLPGVGHVTTARR